MTNVPVHTTAIFFVLFFLLDLIVGHLEHVLQNENIYTENLKNKLK